MLAISPCISAVTAGELVGSSSEPCVPWVKRTTPRMLAACVVALRLDSPSAASSGSVPEVGAEATEFGIEQAAISAHHHAVGLAGEEIADAPGLAVEGLLGGDEAADVRRQDADDALVALGVVLPDGVVERVDDRARRDRFPIHSHVIRVRGGRCRDRL